MSAALLVAAGCVITSMTTEPARVQSVDVEQHRAMVIAKGDCEWVALVVPPGSTVIDPKAKLLYGDGGGRKLDPVRWEPLKRDIKGSGIVRIHTPDLLTGDRVRLRWSIQPMLASGKAGVTEVLSATTDSRTPAEALAEVSRRHLVPDRPDMPALGRSAAVISPSRVVTEMLRGTDLVRADVAMQGTSDQVAQVALSAATPPRIWAHPDQLWDRQYEVRVDGVPVDTVGAPAGEGPSAQAEGTVQRTHKLELPEGADPRVALVPGRGSLAVSLDTWHLSGPIDRPRVRLVHAPPAGVFRSATVAAGKTSQALLDPTGTQAWLIASPGEDPTFSLESQRPDAPICGVFANTQGGDHNVTQGRETTIQADGAVVRQDANGWWIESWDGHPIADERARVIAALDARFARRSLPEPALSVRLRSRLRGWDLVSELSDHLREKAVVSDLPARNPLWPRKLYGARKSGAVTPIEAALIVRAYALQAKVETDWVLVRSQLAPDGPELCESAYNAMLLRLRFDGEDRWLDPACDACAPFEVRPELLGRPALGAWATQSPDPVRGEWRVRVDGRNVTWALDGPAALDVRRWIRSFPVEERKTRLAERMAGPGATLVRVDGLKERGVPVRAEARAYVSTQIPTAEATFTPSLGQITWPGLRIWDVVGGKRVTALLQVGDTSGLKVFVDR